MFPVYSPLLLLGHRHSQARRLTPAPFASTGPSSASPGSGTSNVAFERRIEDEDPARPVNDDETDLFTRLLGDDASEDDDDEEEEDMAARGPKMSEISQMEYIHEHPTFKGCFRPLPIK